MKLCKTAVFFALSTVGLLAQTTAPSGMYWPTGSSTHTSQIFSDQTDYVTAPAVFAGNWLEPGCIFSGSSCTDYRSIQDPSSATEVGKYMKNDYHLGFDIMNLSERLHHPVYAVADGQIMHISYGDWGATSCAEIDAQMPTIRWQLAALAPWGILAHRVRQTLVS